MAVEIERLFEAKRQLQCASNFVACRPWFPWLIPSVFGVLFWLSECLLYSMATLHSPFPCKPTSHLIGCLMMAAFTIPLYRFATVHKVMMQCIVLCVFFFMHHLSMCMVQSLHVTLSIPFGLLNVSLQLWMTMQMIQSQNMRQWLWATITQYLPFALIPQVLLLVVHQPF